MAARVKKQTVETPVVNEVVETKETPTTPSISTDDLLKTLISNVNANANTNTHAKDFIMCHSVTNGGLNINCKSGNVYEFSKYGAECEIEYHDLTSLVRKHSSHIFNPRIVIDDEDFLIEFPQVAKAYESNLYTISDFDTILDLPVDQMELNIREMPKSVFNNFSSYVATKIANGSIDSVRRIRKLSEIYNSDFNLLSELFSN